jgi:hypothetical protein
MNYERGLVKIRICMLLMVIEQASINHAAQTADSLVSGRYLLRISVRVVQFRLKNQINDERSNEFHLETYVDKILHFFAV